MTRLITWDNLLEGLLREAVTAEFPNFIKGEWLTVLNTPPATPTRWKWGLAQTTTLFTHQEATAGAAKGAR